MRDGLLRRTIKAASRWMWSAELVVRRRPAVYDLGGVCRRCARCCEAPAIRVGKLTWYLPLMRRLFLAWQRHVNGFERVSEDDAGRTFTFRCTHFDVATRSCDSYESRPGMCRDYPRALLAQSKPDFFPECGYRPVARNAEQLLAALEARKLTPEQKAKLKKELYLER